MNGLRLIATWTGVALVIAASAGWGPLVAWLEVHDKLAAWVQAVGSVVAIYIAVWSVNRAHANQIRIQAQSIEDEYTRYLEAVYQVVGGAENAITRMRNYIYSVQDELVSLTTLRMMRDELKAVASALDRIDPMTLHRYDCIQAVLVATSTLPGLIHEISTLIDRESHSKVHAGKVAEKAQEVLSVLRPRAALLSDAIRQRGGTARQADFQVT